VVVVVVVDEQEVCFVFSCGDLRDGAGERQRKIVGRDCFMKGRKGGLTAVRCPWGGGCDALEMHLRIVFESLRGLSRSKRLTELLLFGQ
jgi:hypothetical protein